MKKQLGSSYIYLASFNIFLPNFYLSLMINRYNICQCNFNNLHNSTLKIIIKSNFDRK